MIENVSDLTEQNMWECHKALAETDDEWAEVMAANGKAHDMLKVTLALHMELNTGKASQSAKETAARSSGKYKEALDKAWAATETLEKLRAKRNRWLRTIEVWRSLSANRRRS